MRVTPRSCGLPPLFPNKGTALPTGPVGTMVTPGRTFLPRPGRAVTGRARRTTRRARWTTGQRRTTGSAPRGSGEGERGERDADRSQQPVVPAQAGRVGEFGGGAGGDQPAEVPLRVGAGQRQRWPGAGHAEPAQRLRLPDQGAARSEERVPRDVRGEVAGAVRHRRHLPPVPVAGERAQRWPVRGRVSIVDREGGAAAHRRHRAGPGAVPVAAQLGPGAGDGQRPPPRQPLRVGTGDRVAERLRPGARVYEYVADGPGRVYFGHIYRDVVEPL